MQYFLAIVQVAGLVTLFSPGFMVFSTQVELEDELGTQQESYWNDNYVKDLSNGKDYNYYKSTDNSSIIKIDYINNNINIFSNIISLADFYQQ